MGGEDGLGESLGEHALATVGIDEWDAGDEFGDGGLESEVVEAEQGQESEEDGECVTAESDHRSMSGGVRRGGREWGGIEIEHESRSRERLGRPAE